MLTFYFTRARGTPLDGAAKFPRCREAVAPSFGHQVELPRISPVASFATAEDLGYIVGGDRFMGTALKMRKDEILAQYPYRDRIMTPALKVWVLAGIDAGKGGRRNEYPGRRHP